MLGFARALDHELREPGVRVTNIAPGGIATDSACNLRMMTVSFRPMNEGSWG